LNIPIGFHRGQVEEKKFTEKHELVEIPGCGSPLDFCLQNPSFGGCGLKKNQNNLNMYMYCT
jgi:hypothetical protein